MWSRLGSVGVRFGYGLVRLGLGPVRDGLCSFRICCSSTWRKFLLISYAFWRSVCMAVGCPGGQLS